MSLPINDQAHILIVAPHPDDESVGCGGLMLKYGAQCEILLLTDGRKGYDSSVPTDEEELVQLRMEEIRHAAAIAKIEQIHMLGIHDGTLKHNLNIVQAFDITPYDFVFVPNHMERHKDHAPVLKAIQKMCRKQRAAAKIYEYEVWSPIPHPTDILNMDGLMGQKLEMVRQYKSQIRFLDYEAMTEALNRYRGAGYKVQYAEAYSFAPRQKTIKQVYQKLPCALRRIIRRLLGMGAASRHNHAGEKT